MNRLAYPLSLLLTVAGCGGSDAQSPMPDLTAASGCSDDTQCAAPTPRCNLNTRKCVPCLPEGDNCPAGQRCQLTDGTYRCTSSCSADADCVKSSPGRISRCCGGACVDTSSDTQNCGSCGSACLAQANATAACANGRCTIGSCTAGFLDCDHADANGCEVAADSDVHNCGLCNNACTAAANQTAACVKRQCAPRCNPGFADCDASSANGCEVDIATDARNCGGCGVACAFDHAAGACRMQACVLDSCSAGFGDCNASTNDGCEARIDQDVRNCGSCGQVCSVANGTPRCRDGGCAVATCNVGFGDCDFKPANGCEIALLTDGVNCGSCGVRCAGVNSMQACQLGACTITGCSAGFSDCDRQPETGCETSTATDLSNCGACGKVCPAPPNGAPRCTLGMCGLGNCTPGFANCNQMAMDGCETDITTLVDCGSCGNLCAPAPNSVPGCKNGACAIAACLFPYGDCDGVAQTGCERNLSNNPSACGVCGKLCTAANGVAGCVAGVCTVASCNAGFDDCDKVAANGCEVNLNTSYTNCGACGARCAVQEICLSGVCQPVRSLLLVHTDNLPAGVTDLQAKLLSTGAFSVVDQFQAALATPDPARLKQYGAVFLWVVQSFADPLAMGNNLADYYDGGGRVMLAMNGDPTPGSSLAGRFTAANGYTLFKPNAGFGNGITSLGVVSEPNSPLMKGVSTLTNTIRQAPVIVNGGVLVASWADGLPAVVRGTVKGRNRVELNMLPASHDAHLNGWTGDGLNLMLNALLY